LLRRRWGSKFPARGAVIFFFAFFAVLVAFGAAFAAFFAVFFFAAMWPPVRRPAHEPCGGDFTPSPESFVNSSGFEIFARGLSIAIARSS